MGQHSHKSSPNDRKLSPGKRRWTAIAAGAAVVAAASTTAWAAVGNESPDTAGKDSVPAASVTGTPNPPVAAKAAQPKPTTPAPGTKSTPNSTNPTDAADTAASAPKPPAAAQPAPASDASPKTAKTVKPVKLKTTKPRVRVLSSGTCGASYYGEPQMTASGERFNPSAMTAAHKSLPLGSRVRVTNPRSGSSVTVRINDRGPYVGGRCLDLSRAAFDAIGSLGAGVMTVRYEVLAR
ncbi:septal ring lytic transglycosylase RlpA family lipoprotein [Nonomuraea sp. WAC 01424]|uniref:septal ring lytic transglycosylase RlpA family protein n=1 Tax=Nonomuraea sp. WAC 01424 TaxID=2203200 RepID=UPI000F7AF4F5|nr:septal ring lytic transglycosylase RlpA family protein [Nonomuraea sp. WAC 01424]RSN04154.1 septal ring lytic transglycosylase RlpA family lipoprotein [Nonomuraea sp. WAC 01424]